MSNKHATCHAQILPSTHFILFILSLIFKNIIKYFPTKFKH